jgi:hypothetical protein
MNIKFQPLHKIGITITNNNDTKNGQSYYTLALVGSKKKLNVPYNKMGGMGVHTQAIGLLASCQIRVANIINHDENNSMFVIGFNYYDKVHHLFSFAK